MIYYIVKHNHLYVAAMPAYTEGGVTMQCYLTEHVEVAIPLRPTVAVDLADKVPLFRLGEAEVTVPTFAPHDRYRTLRMGGQWLSSRAWVLKGETFPSLDLGWADDPTKAQIMVEEHAIRLAEMCRHQMPQRRHQPEVTLIPPETSGRKREEWEVWG